MTNDMNPGDAVIFNLLLIGRAIDYLPYFIYTFEELGKVGIGKGRGKYSLTYVSPLKIFGEVDFLHAFREASLQMLRRAVEKEIFGMVKILSMIPEDLIGLKLQAIKNNPQRKQREMEDILFLVENYKDKMDWSLIEQYVRLLEMQVLYQEICKER
jgi:hypothetical protein